ncbi:MAG: hypothetical protein LBF78_03475 [Treponema sp.]|jgi:nitroreductase|nr:hypothetical protein [Treponema sp.]
MWEKSEASELCREISRRQSVRKYESGEVGKDILDRLEAAISKAQRLNENQAAFKVLGAELVERPFGGAPCYLAAYAKSGEDAVINASFVLQQLSLWLSARGLGSCWLGMAKPRKEAARADGLPFFKMIAFGRGVGNIYRSSTGEFRRKALSEVSDLKRPDDILEPARLAPSAMNSQSWFFSGDSDKIRLFMAAPSFPVKGLMQPLKWADGGIALCHLWLSALEHKCFAGFEKEDANTIKPPKKNLNYLWTVNLKIL